MNGFTVHAKLPSLNDVIRKNRENMFCGNSYKKETEKIISRYIQRALTTGELKPVSEPCTIRIDWYEKTNVVTLTIFRAVRNSFLTHW